MRPKVDEEDPAPAAKEPEAPAPAKPEPAPTPTEKPVISQPEPVPEPPAPQEQVVLPDLPKLVETVATPVKPPEKPAETLQTPEVKTLRQSPGYKKPKNVADKAVPPDAVPSDDVPNDAIQKAIARVKDKVNQGQAQADGNQGGDGTEDVNNLGQYGVPDGSGPVGGGYGQISDIYKAQISYQIERNWALPDSLAGGGRELRSVVMIRILPDGHIDKVWFEQESGNRVLDESAYKAVIKADPLPPLPQGLNEYVIGLVFTPMGLN